MSVFLKLKKYHADALNLKRLQGLPLSRKFRYLLNTLCGETFRIRMFGHLGLRLVEISLTERCQCSCIHCYAIDDLKALNKDLEQNELSTEQVTDLVDDIEKIGASEIIYTGGEPLLRKDILKLVSYTHQKGLVVRIITNGILLDENLVKNLKNAGLNWCSISIDSPNSRDHDEFRKYPGCFDKAMEGFRLLKKYQIPCSIVSVARKDLINSGDLEKIVLLGKKLGVTIVRINFPIPIGRYNNQQDQVLTLDERERTRELLRSGIVSMESPEEGTSCTAAVTKINILANGDVTPCVFIPLSFGNILEKKLSDIWKNMDSYIKEFKIKGQCPMCDPFLRKTLMTAVEKNNENKKSSPLKRDKTTVRKTS
jgi:AdoMet-dependent heme synthase